MNEFGKRTNVTKVTLLKFHLLYITDVKETI